MDVVESDIRIFADDTFIFRLVDPSSTDALNRDLERITEWAHQWKMVFNPDIKKQAVEVVFSNKPIKGVLPNKLIFNGIPVKTVPETKHIGLILDEKLNFESHLIEKTGKVNQGLGRMKQLKNGCITRRYRLFGLFSIDLIWIMVTWSMIEGRLIG